MRTILINTVASSRGLKPSTHAVALLVVDRHQVTSQVTVMSCGNYEHPVATRAVFRGNLHRASWSEATRSMITATQQNVLHDRICLILNLCTTDAGGGGWEQTERLHKQCPRSGLSSQRHYFQLHVSWKAFERV